jgi:hypothetical protein
MFTWWPIVLTCIFFSNLLLHHLHACSTLLTRYVSYTLRYVSCTLRYTFCMLRYVSWMLSYDSSTLQYASSTLLYASCTLRYASCTLRYASCILRYASRKLRFLQASCTFLCSSTYLGLNYTTFTCLWCVYLPVESIRKSMSCIWGLSKTRQTTDKNVDVVVL